MSEQKEMPGLVRWTGYLSLAMLLILPVAVLAARTGAWQPGLLLYALGMLGSAMLAVLSILQLLLPKFAPFRNTISLNLLFAVPGAILFLSLLSGGNAPAIHDITTDTDNPPVFITAAEQRGSKANTLDIKPDSIAQQLEAYPDLQPLQSTMSTDAAFDRALQVARDLGWQVYHEDRASGIIEAVDTTRFMAFKDDVVIRISAASSGTRIDLRSVSRVGQGDIGANAKRIRAFLDTFDS